MALRQIEIRSGELFLDNAVVGRLTTSPPEGITPSTEISAEERILALKIRWMVETSPEQLLPLEILRLQLGEFYPRAAFIGGRKYDMVRSEPLPDDKLGFPYNTYYKFRIKARHRYDSALYSKMPLACWQEKHRAFAIVFPKWLPLAPGRVPVFISASGARAVVDFSAALLREFQVERKRSGWFGTRVDRKEHKLSLSEGQSLEATFLLVAADTWVECVRACMKHLHVTRRDAEKVSDESLARMLSDAIRFYDRVWDDRNKTHVHLPVKNVPAFESREFKHSHVTDDLTKLVLYRRLVQMGHLELAGRERELLMKLAGGDYCYELDGSRVWHTTTYFNGHALRAFTHHGVGFVGFPGGMATVVRRLFEYCSLDANDVLESLAKSGADWLLKIQYADGSWPASVRKGKSLVHGGCVAGTAEAVRALISAYHHTGEAKYRTAADAAMRFVNREESFFDCRQYLRDVEPNEADGISSEACMHANLDWYSLKSDEQALEQARKWGFYALQWVRPRDPQYGEGPSFDGLSRSITPRVDVWGSLLVARALMRMSRITGEEEWWDYARHLFENITGLQERDGGFSETWFLDYPSGLESVHIEPTFVTDAFVEFILDLCEDERGSSLANVLTRRRNSLREKHPPLDSSRSAGPLIAISRERPMFAVDQRLFLSFVFDGSYGWFNGVIQSMYSMLREIWPGRQLLKLVPLAKILLDRHRVNPPLSKIGKSDFVEVTGFECDDGGDGLSTHRYQGSFHDLKLSIVSTGIDAGNRVASDIEFDVRTLAGDLRVNQVRIDLNGSYQIEWVQGKEEFAVSSGENEYSVQILDGSIDGILQDGNRLALDMSLCSNWNFFGTYNLRLRVTRCTKESS